MNYILNIPNTQNKIIFTTDITQKVNQNETISFYFVDQNNQTIRTNDLLNKILIPNLNKTYDNYIIPNLNNLAIQIGTKIYSHESQTYQFYPIEINLHNIATQYISITDQESEFKINNINSITKNSTKIDFLPNTIYSIKINYNKLFDLNVNPQYIDIDFITNNNKIELINSQYKYIGNNTIFKLNQLKNISLQNILNLDSFNYQFNSVEKENQNSPQNTEINIKQNINQQLFNLAQLQYLNEYSNYFNALDKETENKTEIIQNRLKEFKRFFLQKSNFINCYSKGTKRGIETIFLIFAQSLDYNIIIIEKSPLNVNFVYRVTTNLPETYWKGVIKELVHPVSWSDEYVYIKGTEGDTTLVTYYEPSFYNEYYFNSREYFHRTRNQILQNSNIGISYLDINYNQPYGTYTNVYDVAMIEDFDSHYRFNFSPISYNNPIEYDQTVKDIIIDDIVNYVGGVLYYNVDIDESTFHYNVLIEFLLKGIGLQYEFEVYDIDTNALLLRTDSYEPMFRFKVLVEQSSVRIRIVLINNGYRQEILRDINLVYASAKGIGRMVIEKDNIIF